MRFRAAVAAGLLALVTHVAEAQKEQAAGECDGTIVKYATGSDSAARARLVRPTPGSRKVLVVDAVGGSMCDRGYFGTRDAVALHIVNVNPFLYRYRVTVKGFPAVETAPGQFFASAFGLTLKQLGPEKAPGSVATAALLNAPSECWAARPASAGKPAKPEDLAARCDIMEFKASYDAALIKVQALKNKIAAAPNDMVAFVSVLKARKTIIESGLSVAGDVHRAAEESVNAADAVEARYGGLDASLADAEEAVGTLAKNIVGISKKYPDCEYVKNVAKEAPKMAAALDTAKAPVKEITAQLATIKTERDATSRTIQDPHNFYVTTLLGPYGGPRMDSITIERRPAKAEDKEFTHFGTLNVMFGKGQRMSLGAGFAWAPIPQMEYTTIATLVPPQGGRAGDTLRTIVSQSANIRGRVPPMLTLTTRFYESGNDFLTSANAVVGATLKRADGVIAEFYGGLSLGLLNDWLFVSGGGYIGTVNTLSPGITLGQIVPTGSTAPTSKELLLKPAMMVYFRILR